MARTQDAEFVISTEMGPDAAQSERFLWDEAVPELGERFLTDCAHQWKPNTLVGHRCCVAKQIVPVLGGVPGHADLDSTAGYAHLDEARVTEDSARVGRHLGMMPGHAARPGKPSTGRTCRFVVPTLNLPESIIRCGPLTSYAMH